MSTHEHQWRTTNPYDGAHPKGNDCPLSDSEHCAIAWLGRAGLYRTRLEGAQNGEQRLQSVSIDQLFQSSRSDVLYRCRSAARTDREVLHD